VRGQTVDLTIAEEERALDFGTRRAPVKLCTPPRKNVSICSGAPRDLRASISAANSGRAGAGLTRSIDPQIIDAEEASPHG
jgi:hypothetical protein